MTLDRKSIRVVVAIDFGTSRSGYAYAFTENQQIIGRTEWPGRPPVAYVKTLTHLLYSRDRKEMNWGWEARRRLAEVQHPFGKNDDYNLFQNFKMQLHEARERTQDGPTISTNSGQKFLVLELIADYVKQLKELALKDITIATAGHLKNSEILWCLTVPAIWTNADKQLMRRAAQKAGLIGSDSAEAERLLLVLEPEAAATYCQKNEIDKSQLAPETRFMVVDCGGGTVDITVHEVVEGGGLSEVVEGTGGAYGSTYVDRSFKDYLKKKLKDEVIERYEKDEPIEYLEMMDAWERIKCDFDPQRRSGVIYFHIPTRLYTLLQKRYQNILKRLADEQKGDNLSIHLDRETMNAIFTPTLDGLVKKVEEQFEKLDSQGCDYIFLVGGFSNSPPLRQRIQKHFGMKVKKIIIPQRAGGPGAAIVEGAVSYGLNPPVRARRSRLTYGCNISMPFQPEVDPPEKKIWFEDGKDWYCSGRFDIFVRAGDAVGVNDIVQHTFCPMERNQTRMNLHFYGTKNKQVRYTDENGAEYLGEIVVEMQDTTDGFNRLVDVTMYFGRTEIQVEAKERKSGNSYKTTLVFSSIDSQETDENSVVVMPEVNTPPVEMTPGSVELKRILEDKVKAVVTQTADLIKKIRGM